MICCKLIWIGQKLFISWCIFVSPDIRSWYGTFISNGSRSQWDSIQVRTMVLFKVTFFDKFIRSIQALCVDINVDFMFLVQSQFTCFQQRYMVLAWCSIYLMRVHFGTLSAIKSWITSWYEYFTAFVSFCHAKVDNQFNWAHPV